MTFILFLLTYEIKYAKLTEHALSDIGICKNMQYINFCYLINQVMIVQM